MRVALLGPFELYADHGQVIDLGGVRLRTLLARLALDAGTVVPAEVLVDCLWGADTPTDATNALQTLVSRVRRSLSWPVSPINPRTAVGWVSTS